MQLQRHERSWPIRWCNIESDPSFLSEPGTVLSRLAPSKTTYTDEEQKDRPSGESHLEQRGLREPG